MPYSGTWHSVDLILADVSEERRFTQDLHSATSQKTAFFIVTAVKTSNITQEHNTLQKNAMNFLEKSGMHKER
jgi:hypothetical protein